MTPAPPRKSVKISEATVRRMIDHALRAHPFECCGLVGGRNGFFDAWYPMRNESPFPRRQYAASPSDLFQAMRTMRARGETDLGIYHSHPSSPPRPSPTDIESAFYPEATYFILSPHPLPRLRAYTIVQHHVEAVEIRIFR